MKQPEDTKTLDWVGEPAKRGRGRPRKPDALTNAQRQRNFRQRRAAAKRAQPFPTLFALGCFKRLQVNRALC